MDVSDDEDREVELTLSSDDVYDNSETPNDENVDQDELKYVKPETIKYGESDDEEEDQSEESDESDHQPEIHPATHGQYGLRPRNWSNKMFSARVDIIEETEEPKFSAALKSTQKEKWIQAIEDEFKVIEKIIPEWRTARKRNLPPMLTFYRPEWS